MQLSRHPTLPEAATVPAAIRSAAAALGQRPAVTVLHADGRREEQGFASLLQWTSKGAHWLELDAALGPGDRLALQGPAGWLPAAVCFAAWWVGIEVVVADAGGGRPVDVDLTVAHDGAVAPSDDVLWWGDAVDGTRAAGGAGDDWAIAVQAMPDQPPLPRAEPGAPALATGSGRWTHAELLAGVPARDVTGPVGCSIAATPAVWAPAVVRAVVTGFPTVLLAGAGRDAAAGDRVRTWLD